MSALRDLQDYMKPAAEHIRQTNDNLAEAIATCWQVTDDFVEFQEMSAIDALPFISEVSEEDPLHRRKSYPDYQPSSFLE